MSVVGADGGSASLCLGRGVPGGIREGFLEEGMALAGVFKNDLGFMACKIRHPWLVQMPRE